MTRLLFVCMGNICRSPTAEGVMRAIAPDDVVIDSCGVGSWHVGDAPDARSTAAAAKRGITLEGAARQITAQDFDDFDLLLCADAANVRDVRRLAPDDEARAKVRLLREFDPASDGADLDVPDPYYGGPSGFEDVLDLVQAACEGLLDEVTRSGRSGTSASA